MRDRVTGIYWVNDSCVMKPTSLTVLFVLGAMILIVCEAEAQPEPLAAPSLEPAALPPESDSEASVNPPPIPNSPIANPDLPPIPAVDSLSAEVSAKSVPSLPAAGDKENEPPVPKVPEIPDELLKQIEKYVEENRKLREELDAAIGTRGGISLDPQTLTPTVGPQKDRDEVRRALSKFLRAQYEGTNVEVYMQGEYVVVRLPEATYRLGGVKMPLSIRSRLKPIADAVTKFEADFDLVVEGHADATPMKRGSARSNWTVAFARADDVARELTDDLGVPEKTMAVSSRGSSMPAGPDAFAAANRRVEMVFAPKRSLGLIPATNPEKTESPEQERTLTVEVSTGEGGATLSKPEQTIIELPVIIVSPATVDPSAAADRKPLLTTEASP